MPTPKRKYSLRDIVRQYEKKNLANIESVLDQIMKLMEKGSNKAAYLTTRRKLVNNRFLPPDVRNSIERIIKVFHEDASKVIINGIARARRIADEKNNLITQGYIGGGHKPPTTATQISSSSGGRRRKPPRGPVNTFASDFGKRFNPRSLSPRVWKLSNSYKATIKKTLVDQMKLGTSAKEIAKKLTKNLRNSQGSEIPGQGVYKSPKKNAERLSRTEINLAYEFQDYERWQTLWFVVGVEIRLSAQHPKYDICDEMTGVFPKDFMFPGWHPQCLCIALPVMAPEEVRDAMLDFDLGITDQRPEVKYTTEIPEAAKKWIQDNAERMNGWKNTPYFVQYNQKYVGDLMKEQ